MGFFVEVRLRLDYCDLDAALSQCRKRVLRYAAVGDNLVNVIYAADATEAPAPELR